MYIFTPRGLKIKLSISYVFALFSRLYPKILPYDFLQMVEGVETIPALLISFAAFFTVIAFPNMEPKYICAILTLSWAIGYLMIKAGIYFIPGIVMAGSGFAKIHGKGLIFVPLMVLCYFTRTWEITATVAATMAFWGLIRMAICNDTPERTVICVYQMLAVQCGASTNVDISEEEVNSSREEWLPVLSTYLEAHPEAQPRIMEALHEMEMHYRAYISALDSVLTRPNTTRRYY